MTARPVRRLTVHGALVMSTRFGHVPSRTGVYARPVMPSDDELSPDEVQRLAVVSTEATRLGREEGARVAENHLIAELALAHEEGRSPAYVARLEEELEAVRLHYPAPPEDDG